MTLYFTKTHERITLENDVAIVGISRHAVDLLGDVVFVEHLETEGEVEANMPLAVVESTKAASEVYAPLTGTLIEVNHDIIDNPELVSDDTSESVWFFKIKLSDLSQIDTLLNADAYKEFIG